MAVVPRCIWRECNDAALLVEVGRAQATRRNCGEDPQRCSRRMRP